MNLATDRLEEIALFGTHELRWDAANPDGTDTHLTQAVKTRADARMIYRGVQQAAAEIDANPNLTAQGKAAARAELVAWRSNLDRERANIHAIETARGQLLGQRRAFDAEHSGDAASGVEIRGYLATIESNPGGAEQAARAAIAAGDEATFFAVVNAPTKWPGALSDATKTELRNEFFASKHPLDADRFATLDEVCRTLEADFAMIGEAIDEAAGVGSASEFSHVKGGQNVAA